MFCFCICPHLGESGRFDCGLKHPSYLFMKTENTGQVSVVVIKAPSVLHEKTATQHLADLKEEQNGVVGRA